MTNKILLYGGKSTSLIVHEMLLEKKKKISYIFDEYIKKTHFSHNAQFSNEKKDLKLFIKKSSQFFVCIGMYDGKLRNHISGILKKLFNDLFALLIFSEYFSLYKPLLSNRKNIIY